jgi:hypothetical protein
MAAVRSEAFPVDGPVALVVRAPAGTVEIEAADTSEATVELYPRDNGSAKAVDEAIVELRRGGDRPELVVDVQHGLRFGGRRGGPRLSIVIGRGPSLRIVVRVPRGSSLDVATESADVTGTGGFDRVDVRTAAGDVRLDEVEDDARVKVVSGDVAVERVGGQVSVNSVSGDATIGRVGGPATLHSVSGDIDVREAWSTLHVKTISGDARIGAATEGEVEMQSVSGDLTLGLRSGSKLWVDARSTSGKTTSDLTLGDEPPAAGGPLVEFRAKSVSGDIRVVRAG